MSEEVDGVKEGCSSLWSHCRHLILLVSVFSIAAAKSNDFVFTFTVICITGNSSETEEAVLLTPREVYYAFASAGVGALLSSLIIALVLDRLGGRIVFPSCLVLSGLATLSIPFVIRSGLHYLIPLRLMQGIAFAAVMPMVGFISSRWAPLSEMGNFVTSLTAGIQVSQIITMPLSGELCVRAGWSWSYYIHGLYSIFTAVLFFSIFRNNPMKHPKMGANELSKLQKTGPKSSSSVPYASIFRSPAVWGVWTAFFGNAFGYQTILQFMPTFLNKVLGLAIERTGFSAILPPLMQLTVKLIGGILNDRITCIPERRKLQLFNSFAMIGCGLLLLPIGFLPADPSSSFAAIALFSSSVACMGLITCGSIKSTTLVSRQYSHFVLAIVQFVVCLGYLCVPLFVSLLAPNNSISEWRRVFIGVFIVLMSTNFVFCYFCEAEAASWTKEKREESSKSLAEIPREE